MLKRAGKIFSILAMMAIAVNAQCALSCSFQPAVAKAESAHACCKHDKAPVEQERKRCPNPVAVFGSDIHKSHADQCMLLPLEPSFEFALVVDSARPIAERIRYLSPEPLPLLSLRI